MDALTCLELIHQNQRRRRYRIRTIEPLNWQQFSGELTQQFRHSPVHWRLNQAARCLIIWIDQDGHERELREGLLGIARALERCGAAPAPCAVIRIKTHRIRSVSRSPVNVALNLASGGASFILVVIASLLLLIGMVGMMLPLAPGAPLLLIAALLIELAISMRRPFVATPAA
mgnify:FL=1